jgi:hypothetical protein
MNASKLMSIAALSLLAGAAQAQAIRIEVPDNPSLPASTLARAEVAADYHIWQLSGLDELYRGAATPDPESPQYRRALARYVWLRASPQFAALVAELSVRPNATVIAGK